MTKISTLMSRIFISALVLLLFTSLAFSALSSRVFAPYVDVMAWPTFSISNMYNQTGQKYYTLAFIISGSNNKAAWGGVISVRDSSYYMDEINSIRSVGGDVVISFGGANGTELAQAITDVNTLQAEYQMVIDKYNLTWIDLDIEGAAVADQASVDRRNKAVAGLQAANPGLKVAYCLPVLPSGLTQDGLNVLTNAKQNGVRIDVVNVMAMDFGDWAAPNPEGEMGQYAIDAANNTHSQLDNIGVSTEVGVTPMIGQNDTPSERFYLSDAQQLISWASSKSWVTLLAFWSANRDNGGCPGGSASPSCSGIEQSDFDFTNTFKTFSTSSGGNIPPTVSITTPSSGSIFTEGDNVTINANAGDSDGSVAQVEFFQGSTSLGIDTSSPYSVIWNNVSVGSYSLTAVATDNEGAATTSGAVSITVVASGGCTAPAWEPSAVYVGGDIVSHNGHEWKAKWWTQGEEPGTTGEWGVWEDLGACGGNTPPVVSITSPSDGATFTEGDNVAINANASDSDGSVSKVEFFQGSTSLGIDTSSPYSVTWSNVTAGSYTLTAVATDNEGAATTSGAVSITVSSSGGNTPPVVSITSPSDGATFTEGDNVTINANASDSDGSVSKVEFFQGSTSLGIDTSSPYSVTWSNVTAGSYILTAVATDNEGATTTSGAVSITVNSSGGGSTPAWEPNVSYSIGDQVTYGDKTYSCRQAHTSQLGWEPPNVPALWLEVLGKKTVSSENVVLKEFALYQNRPNPFNPTTNIRFSLDEAGKVTLKIYNYKGQIVRTVLSNAYIGAGFYSENVDMSDMPSGVYIAVLEHGNRILTNKMILLK